MAGKAYQIKDIISGRYYYPKDPGTPLLLYIKAVLTWVTDGKGEISEKSRPLQEGEIGQWILLDGVSLSVLSLCCPPTVLQTPATCANIALHNLYNGEIDLVVCLLFKHSDRRLRPSRSSFQDQTLAAIHLVRVIHDGREQTRLTYRPSTQLLSASRPVRLVLRSPPQSRSFVPSPSRTAQCP